MSENMVTCTIDGVEVTVPKGTTILDAARSVGIEIPHFCYHPGLSIAANCRICLVEVEKARGPLPACHATVMDKMVVNSMSEASKEHQRTVLEFILKNHPVDCPVCDQAGECRLQDYYQGYSLTESVVDVRKVGKPKAKVLGPNVVLDAERCILCTRCVRFTQEISKDFQLQTVGRGNHTEIDTFPGETFDSNYSLNTVDLCPVGALTSRDFRFKKRVWLLERRETVCVGCARGCSAHVDQHDDRVYRYVPRHNPYVNDYWMCDQGRLHFHTLQDNRLGACLKLAAEGGHITADRSYVLTELADKLNALRESKHLDKLGIVVSPNSTNEDLYLTARFAAEVLGQRRFYSGGHPRGDADQVLVLADKNANRTGLEALIPRDGLQSLDRLAGDIDAGQLDALLVIGEHTLPDDLIQRLNGVSFVAALTALNAPWLNGVDLALATPLPFENTGTVVNADGRVQKLQVAVRRNKQVTPVWAIFGELAKMMGNTELQFASAKAVFAEIAVSEQPFGGLSWSGLSPHGAMLAGHQETTSPTIHEKAGRH